MSKRLLQVAVMLAVFASLAFSQSPAKSQPEVTQIVPPLAVTGKTIIARVHWPSASRADQNAVQYDAEKFLKKWNRHQIVQDINQADLAKFQLGSQLPRTMRLLEPAAQSLRRPVNHCITAAIEVVDRRC